MSFEKAHSNFIWISNIGTFLKFPVYLSGNATLTVKAQDNGNEYEYNPQSGTPPDRPSVQSIKDERRSV